MKLPLPDERFLLTGHVNINELDVSHVHAFEDIYLENNPQTLSFTQYETALQYGKRVARKFGYDLRIKTTGYNHKEGVVYKYIVCRSEGLPSKRFKATSASPLMQQNSHANSVPRPERRCSKRTNCKWNSRLTGIRRDPLDADAENNNQLIHHSSDGLVWFWNRPDREYPHNHAPDHVQEVGEETWETVTSDAGYYGGYMVPLVPIHVQQKQQQQQQWKQPQPQPHVAPGAFTSFESPPQALPLPVRNTDAHPLAPMEPIGQAKLKECPYFPMPGPLFEPDHASSMSYKYASITPPSVLSRSPVACDSFPAVSESLSTDTTSSSLSSLPPMYPVPLEPALQFQTVSVLPDLSIVCEWQYVGHQRPPLI